MKEKYFSGPCGVYYDRKMDAIFYLEPTGVMYINRNGETAYEYIYYCEAFPKGTRAFMTGMEYCEKIGEL